MTKGCYTIFQFPKSFSGLKNFQHCACVAKVVPWNPRLQQRQVLVSWLCSSDAPFSDCVWCERNRFICDITRVCVMTTGLNFIDVCCHGASLTSWWCSSLRLFTTVLFRMTSLSCTVGHYTIPNAWRDYIFIVSTIVGLILNFCLSLLICSSSVQYLQFPSWIRTPWWSFSLYDLDTFLWMVLNYWGLVALFLMGWVLSPFFR